MTVLMHPLPATPARAPRELPTLGPDELVELIVAVDDAVDAAGDLDKRARLARGRNALLAELAEELAR